MCVLSVYNRTERVDKFRVAHRSNIDLYENICAGIPTADAAVKFKSDLDTLRTTLSIKEIFPVTQKPNSLSDTKQLLGKSLRRVREQPPSPRIDSRKRQQRIYAIPHVVKMLPVTNAKSDVVLSNMQIDGDSHSVFKLLSKGWRLPPIRRGTIARHSYVKTVILPRSDHNSQVQQQNTDFAEVIRPITEVSQHTEVNDTTTTVKPMEELQTEKFLSCFKKTKQQALYGYEEQTLRGVDLNTCLNSCIHMNVFLCASVNYDESNRVCTLNGGSPSLNELTYLNDSSSDFYENECNQAEDAEQIVINSTTLRSGSTLIARCFHVMTNSLMLDLEANLLENIDSLDTCQSECIRSVRQCGAINWLPYRRSCMLMRKTVEILFEAVACYSGGQKREEIIKDHHNEFYDDRPVSSDFME
ncbi:PAN domain protein [Dictyocaulus viviparus]|uniref:PAN domain protein n=1 Tax=Dictyocaulus viviparus TaxID=29172 RepID=A0A0D8XSU8_DICVI|nr:PAN domain protein [Dictyocaulus viviparus]